MGSVSVPAGSEPEAAPGGGILPLNINIQGAFFMEIIFVPLLCAVLVIVTDLLSGFIGLAFAYTKKFHRLGVRLVAMSCFLYKYTPEVCALPCSCGNCGNWTCPHFPECYNPRSATK